MKLFVSDLDGTLYKDGTEHSKGCNLENRKAILEWVKQGNAFAVATARGIASYEHLCKELGIRINYVGSNGGEILLATGQQLIKKIKAQIYIDICRYIYDKNIDATVVMDYCDQRICSGKDRYPFVRSKRDVTWWASCNVMDLSEIDPEHEIQKIGMLIRPDARDEIKEILRQQFKELADIVSSDYDNIDVGPQDCSKGTGVQKLADYFNLTMEDVATVGDSENDIPMLMITRHSYAMSHAEPLVKQAAQHVTETVAEAIYAQLKHKL